MGGSPQRCDDGFSPNENRSRCVADPVAARSSNDAGIASPTNLAAVVVCIIVIVVVAVMVVKRSQEKASVKKEKERKAQALAEKVDVKYNPVYSPFNNQNEDSGD